MTQYIEFTADLLAQVGENIALTKEMAHAHSCCNEGGKHLHYCTMYKGKRYITSEEQREQAGRAYAINKAAAVAAIGEKLVFVGMGMNYESRYEDDVCNHRIRTEIVNPEGRRFFIEVCTGRGENMHITHVVDRDQEDEYNLKAQEYRNKIEQAGGFWKIGKGHPLYENYQIYMSQPYYWYKKDDWFSLNAKFTCANVLKLVNNLFDCNFTEMAVDYYHLNTDDYVSTSPSQLVTA